MRGGHFTRDPQLALFYHCSFSIALKLTCFADIMFLHFAAALGFPGGLVVKNPPVMWVRPLGQENPLEVEWQPTPVFLLGKSHGQRSLVAAVHGVTESQTRLSD